MANQEPGRGLELAPDLDWLLESEQTNPDVLSEALVKAYWVPLYRLAYATLNHPDEAAWACMQILVTSLLKVYTYRSEQGARIWFFRLALKFLETARRRQPLRKLLEGPPRPGEASSDPGPTFLMQAVNELPEPLRLALLLERMLGWPVAQVAQTLDLTEKAVQIVLQAADRRMASFGQGWEESLIDCCWPAAALSEAGLERIAVEVQAQATRLASRRLRAIRLGEVLLVGLAVLLVFVMLWGANTFYPEEPQPTPFPTRATSPPAVFATPALQFSYLVQPGDSLDSVSRSFGLAPGALAELNHLGPNEQLFPWTELDLPDLKPPWEIRLPNPGREDPPPVEALAGAVSPGQVRRLLQAGQKYWQTLWVEYRTTFHGWPGYSGPPLFSQRTQIWARQPGWRVTLDGEYDSIWTDYATISLGRYDYTFHEYGDLHVRVQVLEDEQLAAGVGGLLYPYRMEWLSDEALKGIGHDRMASREAVVVEWQAPDLPHPSLASIDHTRFWLDAQTGVVLRSQEFGGRNGNTLMVEIEAIAIEFDLDLPPPSFFDPRNGHLKVFASGPEGHPAEPGTPPAQASLPATPAAGHEPIEKVLPPPGFDPSRQFLTFQYPAEATTARSRVELFAGQYFLGLVDFAASGTVSCVRSLDGLKIAFYGAPLGQPLGDPYPVRFGWFSLDHPAETHFLDFDFNPMEISFDPQGRRLAAFGFRSSDGESGLFLVDLETSTLRLLKEVALNASSLVWSPDGRFLAYLVDSRAGDVQTAAILEAASGEVVYEKSVPPYGSLDSDVPGETWPAPDWPGHAWNIEFPAAPSWLGGCTAPAESPR